MFEGGRATLIVPSELAFKAMDYSSIGIPRFSTLLIDVEVVKVIKP
jgi:FKBP-type peptidyl-prolyl cis-trans isomerase